MNNAADVEADGPATIQRGGSGPDRGPEEVRVAAGPDDSAPSKQAQTDAEGGPAKVKPYPDRLKKRLYFEELEDHTKIFADAKSDKPVIVDYGERLDVKLQNPDAIRGAVEIASHRGWESITVSGSDDFRRAIWLEASALGMDVNGFVPGDRDLQELGRRGVHPARKTDDIERSTPARSSSIDPGPPASVGEQAPQKKDNAPARPEHEPSAGEPAPSTDISPNAMSRSDLAGRLSEAQDVNAFPDLAYRFPELAPALARLAAIDTILIEGGVEPGERARVMGDARSDLARDVMLGTPIEGPPLHKGEGVEYSQAVASLNAEQTKLAAMRADSAINNDLGRALERALVDIDTARVPDAVPGRDVEIIVPRQERIETPAPRLRM